MKIALIEPSLGNAFLKRMIIPKLGLPQIGAILQQAGHEVRIHSEIVQPIDWQKVFAAELVGISPLSCNAPRAYLIAQKIKEMRKGIGIIMGGPHVTACPEEALANGANAVVRHEGEDVIVSLVEAWESRDERALKEIPNLSWRSAEGEIIHKKMENSHPWHVCLWG
jgi:radical SAM superfamily enzyme YgiQ (UPF0313 family)